MNKLQRLATLKQEAAALEAEIKAENGYEAWEPEFGETYWFIEDGKILISNVAFSMPCKAIVGNCFQSSEEAENWRKWLHMLTAIRKYAKKANEGWEPDYPVNDGVSIFIAYDTNRPEAVSSDDRLCILPMFHKQELADECIKLYDTDTWKWFFSYLQLSK